MKDSITPEEKLLRLIRKEKKQDRDIVAIPKHSLYPLIQKYLSSLYIRKIILVVFVASCIYLIISLVYPWVGLRKIKLPQLAQEKAVELKIEPKQQIRPYEFYQEAMGERQIFSSFAGSGQETTAPIGAVNTDLIKDINLVGIISGENPQAVIEDKKTQKTYYVTKGQFIGELQLEDIQAGKIILNHHSQRFELYL